MPMGAPCAVAQDLEDRERPPQQRIDVVARLDHHELAGLGGRGDFGRLEREDVVVGREPPVGEHARVDIERASMTSIVNAECWV